MNTTYNSENSVPVVMAFSASDSCGGAGIQADIEALGSMGCHCTPIITAITAQDTNNVKAVSVTDDELVKLQARTVLQDMSVDVFKIGAMGSIENVKAIHQILTEYPDIPVVLDPALKMGMSGYEVDDHTLEAIIALIVPELTMLSVNAAEAKMMAPEADTLEACAQELMSYGAEYVLISGAEKQPNKTTNTLYGNYRQLQQFDWKKLKSKYHGSGCTLASAIAGLLAQGLEPFSAAHQAQEYTFESLMHGYRIGMGQHLPNRLFWARECHLDYNAKSKN